MKQVITTTNLMISELKNAEKYFFNFLKSVIEHAVSQDLNFRAESIRNF